MKPSTGYLIQRALAIDLQTSLLLKPSTGYKYREFQPSVESFRIVTDI